MGVGAPNKPIDLGAGGLTTDGRTSGETGYAEDTFISKRTINVEARYSHLGLLKLLFTNPPSCYPWSTIVGCGGTLIEFPIKVDIVFRPANVPETTTFHFREVRTLAVTGIV